MDGGGQIGPFSKYYHSNQLKNKMLNLFLFSKTESLGVQVLEKKLRPQNAFGPFSSAPGYITFVNMEIKIEKHLTQNFIFLCNFFTLLNIVKHLTSSSIYFLFIQMIFSYLFCLFSAFLKIAFARRVSASHS